MNAETCWTRNVSKNSLRSKEFVALLNNLGNCISYDKVLSTETEWADALLVKDDSYTMVPTNITSRYFTQAAAVNADYA